MHLLSMSLLQVSATEQLRKRELMLASFAMKLSSICPLLPHLKIGESPCWQIKLDDLPGLTATEGGELRKKLLKLKEKFWFLKFYLYWFIYLILPTLSILDILF
jgi:hypothetical protein